jgi:hypothetical protein
MQTCDECGQTIKLRNTGGVKWYVTCACGLEGYEPAELATVVVLSKFPEIFEQCRASVDKFAPRAQKILVRDGHAITSPLGWKTIQAPEGKFVYARNANLGIAASTGDVFLMNDDVSFTHFRTLETLQAIMAKHPEVGILSPKIVGDVGEYQQSHCEKTLVYTQVRLCFVAILLRREMLEKTGLLDERFTGYGYDDCSACREAVKAGYKLGVTARATVTHGFGEHRRSASFNRQEYGTINALDALAQKQYFEKYGDLSLECK